MIKATAPCRISLAGGGTDVNPYAARRGGKVFSVAVNLHTAVTLRPHRGPKIHIEAMGEKRLLLDFKKPLNYRKDPKFDLIRAVMNHFRRDIPSGFRLCVTLSRDSLMGLGSSGSAAVALIAAFSRWIKKDLSPRDMARLAYRLETEDLEWPGGKQDQFASAYGGANVFIFGPGHAERAVPVELPPAAGRELRRWSFLVFVGGYRHSKEQQKILVREMRKSDRLKALDNIKNLVDPMVMAFQNRDWESLGRMLHRSWLDKKRSNNVVSNEWIDALYSAVRREGALGGKISGSGGAGHMFFICPPGRRRKALQTLVKAGAVPVPFDFDFRGAVARVVS